MTLDGEPFKPETELWYWIGHLAWLLDSDESFAKSSPEAGNAGENVLPHTRYVGARQITEKLSSTKIEVRWVGLGVTDLPNLVHYQSEER